MSTHQLWAARHGLSVDRRRIRTTYLSLRDRSRWHGSSRSAIDPNHTPAVEGDHYLTAATPAQRAALDTIIEDAQRDLLGKAHPPVVLADEDAAELAAAYPGLVAGLNLDDATIAGLLSGEQDVFTAACADPLSGLHGPPGKPCPARPWVCLLCPLAVFTPRHAANLLRLKAFFARQWNQMPSAQFMAVFGPYSTRITQILERYPAPLIAAAAAEAGERRRPPDPPAPGGAHDMTTPQHALAQAGAGASVLAGADVCAAAGFRLRPRGHAAMFDDDIWSFGDIEGLSVQMSSPASTRLDFTAISDPRWRLAAKEYLFARLAPGHPEVAVLPRAFRVPLTLPSCLRRLAETARWMNWLTAQQVPSLGDVTQDHCDRYLAERRLRKDAAGTVIGTLEAVRHPRRRRCHHRAGQLRGAAVRRPLPRRVHPLERPVVLAGRRHAAARGEQDARREPGHPPAAAGSSALHDQHHRPAPGDAPAAGAAAAAGGRPARRSGPGPRPDRAGAAPPRRAPASRWRRSGTSPPAPACARDGAPTTRS